MPSTRPELASVARLVSYLDEAGIPYMVVGSVASTLYGEPRSTLDVDMVVDPTPQSLRRLMQALPEEDYYFDEGAAMEALNLQRMFNVLDQQEILKLDLIVRKSGTYDAVAFKRRVRMEIGGVSLFFASAEDTILAKLRWSQATDSERQLRDIQGVIRVMDDDLDWTYLDAWAEQLGVEAQLQALRVG